MQRAQLDRLLRYGQRAAVGAATVRQRALKDDAARLDQEFFGGRDPLEVVHSPGAECRGLYVRHHPSGLRL